MTPTDTIRAHLGTVPEGAVIREGKLDLTIETATTTVAIYCRQVDDAFDIIVRHRNASKPHAMHIVDADELGSLVERYFRTEAV